MADVIVFDPSAFRAAFPAYASSSKYSDATLNAYFDTAAIYTTTNVNESLLGASQTRVLWLLTAHLTFISDTIASGGALGNVSQSSIGQVSVSMDIPTAANSFQYWLNLSPYGQQLLALLQIESVGGMYIGGLPERSAFRKVGGIF